MLWRLADILDLSSKNSHDVLVISLASVIRIRRERPFGYG